LIENNPDLKSFIRRLFLMAGIDKPTIGSANTTSTMATMRRGCRADPRARSGAGGGPGSVIRPVLRLYRSGVVDEERDIPFQYEFTVSADTASQMAWAFVRWSFRSIKMVLGFGVLFVLSVAWFYAQRSEDPGGERLLLACIGAVVFTGVLLAGSIAIPYLMNRRMLRQSLPEGEVVRTGFGADAFVSSSSRGFGRIPYDTVRSVAEHRGFVFVRTVGSLITLFFPDEVFPADAVERIQRHLAARPAAA